MRGEMKKKDLEIRLQSLELFSEPKAHLEQYPTPSVIASDILFSAYAAGDIAGKTVADLGCGTGIFAIGASLLDASKVTAFDIDGSALEIAGRNAESLGCDIEFVKADIKDVEGRFDTVLMNPPFGSQNKHADTPFLTKAMDIADSVYSIHMACTSEYIEKTAESAGKTVTGRITYKYEIPHTFAFHNKTKKSVDVIAVSIR
ncbi:MAG: methyltransferase [Candidatus Methanomethylophilaceae archaeon]|nr:methyltransferase [Candidatus Methanomethylophilaceae archaeon]